MLDTVFRENLFANQVALITGGGTGIGLRAARELAKLGATVVLASRKMENLEKGVAQIRADGGVAHAITCNIRDEDSVRSCVAQALELAGSLHMLVNNAGGQFPSPAESITAKGWHAVIETNLTGTFLMTREVFTQTMRDHGGRVVNVIANYWNGFPNMAHTGAARAGVDNLTQSLAVEWGRYGVRLNAIAPGIIRSSGLEQYPPPFKDFVYSAGRFNQANRLGSEAEIASSILFLLSPGASFITGETLRVDGGDLLFTPLHPPVAHDKLPAFDDLPD